MASSTEVGVAGQVQHREVWASGYIGSDWYEQVGTESIKVQLGQARFDQVLELIDKLRLD